MSSPLAPLMPGAKVPFTATVRYLRPNIIGDLRSGAQKLRGPRRVLLMEAANEIEELRAFIDKQSHLISRILSEVTT